MKTSLRKDAQWKMKPFLSSFNNFTPTDSLNCSGFVSERRSSKVLTSLYCLPYDHSFRTLEHFHISSHFLSLTLQIKQNRP